MSDSIPQLGDPFSAAASQQTAPGFLGQSPAFWQHLAMFGGNLVQGANARTPSGHLANGTGFAGPFGAAIGATAQQAQEQAKSQSDIAKNRADTTSVNLGNTVKQAQIPAQLLQAQFQTNAMQDPGLRAALGYSDSGSSAPYTAPSFGQQPSGGGNTPAFESGVHQNESGGSMAPGVTGDGGQAHGVMQMHADALKDVNSTFGTNLTPQQLDQWPELGKWAGDRYLALQQQKFGPVNGVAAYNAGPGRTQQAIAGQAPLPASTVNYVQRATGQQPSVPQSTGQQAQAPQQPQAPQPAGGGPGDSYLQQADVLTARANRIAQAQATSKLVGLPVGPGMAMDPTALHTQAQQLREQGLKLNSAGPLKQAEANVDLNTAGPIQAEKSKNSNVDLREGGMARVINPSTGQPEWIKNPKLEEQVDPATGQKTYTHVSPALPGSPPGMPGTSDPVLGADGQPVVQGIAPNVQEARKKAYEDFAGKDTDSFIAAKNMQGVLGQMNEAARVMNQTGGMMGTGPTAPWRLPLASKVNDILRTSGLPTVFDQNAEGAWQELIKSTTTAGFEMSSHYEGHARQAAQTIENATSAQPGEKNSPVGFAKVYAGNNEIGQYSVDLHNAKLPVYSSGGDLVKAETDFVNKFPPQMYTRRAISTVTPYPISNDKELTRYLPGTFVSYKGNVVQVPQRPGAPPVPDYIHDMHQPQPGQPQGPQQLTPSQ